MRGRGTVITEHGSRGLPCVVLDGDGWGWGWGWMGMDGDEYEEGVNADGW